MRDNKRRYRSRKKEYISDLERRLEEVRQEGVQATKEVQLSAQKVVKENARLRALLRHLGTGEDVVEYWVNGDMCHLKEPVGFTKQAREVVLTEVAPVRLPSSSVRPRHGC